MDADVRALKVPPAQALSSGHGLGVDLLVIDDTDGGCDISAIEAELASGGDSTLFLHAAARVTTRSSFAAVAFCGRAK